MAKRFDFDSSKMLTLVLFGTLLLFLFNLVVDTSGDEWQILDFGASQAGKVFQFLIAGAAIYIPYSLINRRGTISRRDVFMYALAVGVLWALWKYVLPSLTGEEMSLARLAFAVAGPGG